MLAKIVESGSNTINLEELGITDMKTVLEDMNENENLLEDLEKPWEQKLAEKKEKDAMKALEMAETQNETLPVEDSSLLDGLEESKQSISTTTPQKGKDQKNVNDSLFSMAEEVKGDGSGNKR